MSVGKSPKDEQNPSGILLREGMSACENFLKYLGDRQLNVTVIIVFTKKHNSFNTFDSSSKGAQEYEGENTISQLISPFASVRLDELADIFKMIMLIWSSSVVADAFPFYMFEATTPVVFKKTCSVRDEGEQFESSVLQDAQVEIFAK